jgi:hypothetical protein
MPAQRNDDANAPCCYSSATYSPVTYPGVTFYNGVILNESSWNNEATSAPNVLGTSDFLPLADGSFLAGNIDAHFSSPVSNVNFDVINGFIAADFMIFAFDANGNTLDSVTISLNNFTSFGDTAHVSLNVSGISEVVIDSGQGSGSIDFASDTWSWNGSSTPEPGSLLLLGSGVTGLWSQRKRFLS